MSDEKTARDLLYDTIRVLLDGGFDKRNALEVLNAIEAFIDQKIAESKPPRT